MLRQIIPMQIVPMQNYSVVEVLPNVQSCSGSEKLHAVSSEYVDCRSPVGRICSLNKVPWLINHSFFWSGSTIWSTTVNHGQPWLTILF